MADWNLVALAGRLVEAPQLRRAGESPVCLARLAQTVRRQVDGAWQDCDVFWNVEVWGRDAEFVARSGAPGAPLSVEGELIQVTWRGREGEARADVRIRARRLYLVQRPAQDTAQDTAEEHPAEQFGHRRRGGGGR